MVVFRNVQIDLTRFAGAHFYGKNRAVSGGKLKRGVESAGWNLKTNRCDWAVAVWAGILRAAVGRPIIGLSVESLGYIQLTTNGIACCQQKKAERQ